MIGELFPLVTVTLKGIRHVLDDSGSYCMTCGELSEWLLEEGGEGSF